MSGMDPKLWVRDIARRLCDNANNRPVYQTVADFVTGRDSVVNERIVNRIAEPGNIRRILPTWLGKAYQSYLAKLHCLVGGGIISAESILYGPEIKYWTRKFKVTRGWQVVGAPEGVHVIGSCSGHVDSFVAAAVSGMACADFIDRGYLLR